MNNEKITVTTTEPNITKATTSCETGIKKNKTKGPKKPMSSKFKATLDALNWLRDTFPKAFVRSNQYMQPLKIGLGVDVFEFLKANNIKNISTTTMRNALRMYTSNAQYLRASTKVGEKRIDLEGHEQGEVIPEQAQYAENKLADKKKARNVRETKAAQEATSIGPEIRNAEHRTSVNLKPRTFQNPP